MRNGTLRAALVIAALAALGAGAYVVFQAERELRAAAEAVRVFDDRSQTAARALERVRASQQAYVAEGQGAEFWMSEASRHLEEVGRVLGLLASSAGADAARTAVQSATESVEDFRKLDGRAREYLARGQELMASDLIFNESLGAITGARDQLQAARTRELDTRRAQIAALRTRQLYAASGAAALLVLALFLLAPIPQPELDVLSAMRALTTAPTASAKPAVQTPAEPLVRDEFSEVLSPAKPARQQTPAQAHAQAPVEGTVARESQPAASSIDLPATAELCADFARVLDASELPALLARAARIVEAPGLIVWVSDRDGRELYPLLTHGYEPQVVMRLGTIPTDAENATAAAWRTARLKTVPAADDTPGAVVAPIVTSNGCVGVIAAEIEAGRERAPESHALLTIFAAQLATFVTTLPAGQAAEAARG